MYWEQCIQRYWINDSAMRGCLFQESEPPKYQKNVSDILIRIRFPFESSFWYPYPIRNSFPAVSNHLWWTEMGGVSFFDFASAHPAKSFAPHLLLLHKSWKYSTPTPPWLCKIVNSTVTCRHVWCCLQVEVLLIFNIR